MASIYDVPPPGVPPLFSNSLCDNSEVLWLRSIIKYNEDSSHQILTNQSHVLGVPFSNFGGPASKIFLWGPAQ